MPHIVKSYEQELTLLDNKISHMGGIAEFQLSQAFGALQRHDPKLAALAISSDKAIDALQREIEDRVQAIIAKRQPVAVDLRQIVATLKISNDLERIGDFSKNIAKRALAIADQDYPTPLLLGLSNMVGLALRQLKNVLDAYSERDADKALAVWRRDEQLDAIYNSVFRELLTYMMEDPRNIGLSIHLLFVAKNLERIGDHATNVAETTSYLVLGVFISDERPKADNTSTA